MKNFAPFLPLTALALGACAVVGPIPDASSSPSPSADVIAEVTAPSQAEPTALPELPVSVLPVGGAAKATATSRVDVATGLTAPWDLIFDADGSMLISLRESAKIVRVRDGVRTTLSGPGAAALKSAATFPGEGGLLGLALLPSDTTVLYAYVTRANDNAVYRLSLNGDTLDNATVVLEGIPRARNHDGGRLRFGPDGYLYVTTGDAAKPDLAQDKNSLAGKILRVVATGGADDGAAAPGNPFGTRVWTYGHRNVQGIAWAPDGRMYASEFGQNDRDELNLIEPGNNYGWPTVEALAGAPAGTKHGETRNGLTYPVADWATRDASPSGIAITNEAIYVAALRGETVWRVPLTETGTNTPHRIVTGLGRIRAVSVGPDGLLYIVTNNTDGRGDPNSSDDRVAQFTIVQG